MQDVRITAASTPKSFFDQEKKSLIWDIAKRSLVELAVIGVMAGVTLFFVANPMTALFIVGCALITFTVNILFRVFLAYIQYRINHSENESEKKFLEKIFKVGQWFAPISFSCFQAQTANVLIHESGHALAANLLFKTKNTTVTVQPWGAGFTSYILKGFTSLGAKLGYAGSDLVVTAAGTGLAVGVSAVALGIGLGVEKMAPETSKYLISSAVINVITHAYYALSALWTSSASLGHDFVQLALYGIHPAVAVIGIIAIPLIVRTGFAIYEYIKDDGTKKPEPVQLPVAV